MASTMGQWRRSSTRRTSISTTAPPASLFDTALAHDVIDPCGFPNRVSVITGGTGRPASCPLYRTKTRSPAAPIPAPCPGSTATLQARCERFDPTLPAHRAVAERLRQSGGAPVRPFGPAHPRATYPSGPLPAPSARIVAAPGVGVAGGRRSIWACQNGYAPGPRCDHRPFRRRVRT